MRSVIRFLNAKNMKRWNSSSTLWLVWRTCHELFNGTEMGATVSWRTQKCAWWSVDWLIVVNENLVCAVEEKIRENRQFTITSLSLHFPQISLSLLHEIVSDKLKFQKLCAHCVLKMLTEGHKLKCLARTLDFLTQCSEEGENFLSHVVTGNEIWV